MTGNVKDEKPLDHKQFLKQADPKFSLEQGKQKAKPATTRFPGKTGGGQNKQPKRGSASIWD